MTNEIIHGMKTYMIPEDKSWIMHRSDIPEILLTGDMKFDEYGRCEFRFDRNRWRYVANVVVGNGWGGWASVYVSSEHGYVGLFLGTRGKGPMGRFIDIQKCADPISAIEAELMEMDLSQIANRSWGCKVDLIREAMRRIRGETEEDIVATERWVVKQAEERRRQEDKKLQEYMARHVRDRGSSHILSEKSMAEARARANEERRNGR